MITDGHRRFARAVVMMARTFGIGSFSLSFGLSARSHEVRRETFGRVMMAWHDGRNSDESGIELRYEATESISEKEEK